MFPEWLASYFQRLNATTGVNFPVFYDPFEAERFVRGLVMTTELSLGGAVLSLLIGVAGVAVHRQSPLLRRWLIEPYVLLFRNTPVLIQMFFFYFAIGPLLPKTGTDGQEHLLIEGFGWTMVTLSLYIGAFNIESLRAGCSAVPPSLTQAARALGLTDLQAFKEVVLPLGLRNSIPALTNNLVELVKTTALAYALGVAETLYVASQIWSDQLNVVEMMVLLFVVYMVLIGLVVALMAGIERATRLPGHAR